MSEAGSHLAVLVSSTISDKVVVDCTDYLALSLRLFLGLWIPTDPFAHVLHFNG